jgi:hypothetical protein
MAENINNASDQPVIVGDFAHDLWAGKSSRLNVGLCMAFIYSTRGPAHKRLGLNHEFQKIGPL